MKLPKLLEWKKDKWNSKHGDVLPYDKVEHFIRDGIITLIGLFVFEELRYAVIVSIGFNILYEVYNGYVPYDGEHIQGFSIKDFLAGITGTILTLALYTTYLNIVSEFN